MTGEGEGDEETDEAGSRQYEEKKQWEGGEREKVEMMEKF